VPPAMKGGDLQGRADTRRSGCFYKRPDHRQRELGVGAPRPGSVDDTDIVTKAGDTPKGVERAGP
jgi:hypothetical protein